MQFKSLAIIAAIAGFVAAAPATTETHVSAVNAEDKDILVKLATQYGAASVTGPDIVARDNAVVRRACGYESWGVCTTVENVACAFRCGGKYSCLLGCPQESYAYCDWLGC